MKAIKVFDPSTYGLSTRSNLTAKRWYPSTITLPNGDIYVPGEKQKGAAAPAGSSGSGICNSERGRHCSSCRVCMRCCRQVLVTPQTHSRHQHCVLYVCVPVLFAVQAAPGTRGPLAFGLRLKELTSTHTRMTGSHA